MSGKEEGITTAASSFSVEVVASLSDEKNMSFSLLKKASGLSLVDQCEPGEQESGPALVRVGSNSESDNSSVASSETDENYQVVEPFELSSPHVEVQTGVKTAVVPKEEDGMYDCLSDHFSNLFCPVEQEALPPSTTEVAKTDTQAIVSCTDVACTEVACTTTSCTALQFFDIINANPGADMLSSLQDWLAPSQEESRNSELQKPQNRSCSTKRKSAYTRRLWNNWYPENGIPIERSESMPEAPTPSIQDLHFDVFYDSDPEQEHKDRKTRAESLIRRQNYKDRSPSSIHTLFYDGMDSSSSFENYKLCPPTPRNSELQQTFDFKSRSCSYSYETPVNGASMDTPLFFDSPVALTEFDLLHPDGDEMLKRFCQVSNLWT